MFTNKWLFAVISVALIAALTACSKGSSSNEDKGGQSASATIKIDISKSATKAPAAKSQTRQSQAGKARAAALADIVSITVDVLNGTTELVTGALLTENNGVWSATISDLPTEVPLTVVAHAYDNGATEIYTGTTSQVLTGVNDQIVIVLDSTTNETTLQFPILSQVSLPGQIVVSTSSPVSISLRGNAGETLTYTITAQAGGGTFDPAGGSVTLNGTTATVVLNYTAPATAGTFTHGITVVNSQGNTIASSFDTTIAEGLSSPEVIVQFNPSVYGMFAARNGSNVTFTASVSDAGPANELVYAWSFDGGLSFTDPAVNPAVLQGYDESISGTLTLTVTNASGGNTTVYYAVQPGQFPNTVVSNLMYLPQTFISTGRSACGDTSVSGNIIALSMEEYGDQQDYNSDGDMDDCVAGYYDISTGAVVNTGIAAEFTSVGGNILAFMKADTGTLGYYSISAHAATDTGIVLAGFSNNDSNHFVSNGKISFVAALRDLNGDSQPDNELCIYDTVLHQNTPTGVMAGDSSEEFHPSFSGNIVAYKTPAGTIGYYDVVTGQATDTGLMGTETAIDNGTIVFNSSAGYVAYYVLATGNYTLTPLLAGGAMPSISDGIIAISADEWSLGDLNRDGDNWDPIAVLYDIPTGRMINTGLQKYHWGEISNDVIECRASEEDLNVDFNGDGDMVDVAHAYAILNDLAKSYLGR